MVEEKRFLSDDVYCGKKYIRECSKCKTYKDVKGNFRMFGKICFACKPLKKEGKITYKRLRAKEQVAKVETKKVRKPSPERDAIDSWICWKRKVGG